MEKRFALAFGLSILILLGWALVERALFPTPAAPPPGTVEAPAPALPKPEPAPRAKGTAPAAALPSAHGSVPIAAPATSAAAEQDVIVDTPIAAIVLTNKGARVRSWRLHGYDTGGRPVDFVSDLARQFSLLPLSLAFDDPATLPEVNASLYEVKREVAGDGAERVAFSWSDGAGSSVRKVLVFPKSGGLVGVEIEATDRGHKVTPRLIWGPGLEVEDPKTRANTYYNGQALALDSGHVLRLAKRKIDAPTGLPTSSRLDWAGLADQYFAALVLPAGSTGSVTIAPLPLSPLARPGVEIPKAIADAPTIAVALPEGKAELFVGPKNFGLLESLGHGLERAVWFSDYALIYACAKPVFLALRWVHANWIGNWGLAIILLTIGLRVLLFPLNQYSMVKMRKVAGEMQRIQPKLKAIQAKYKKSKDAEARAKMNAETMEMYKREGVNPFGGISGCLPLFVQMPILWAFFDVLTATVELRGAPFFLWIQDLTHPDRFWITPILMGATMFAQQKMTPTPNPDPQQQRMLMFMPVMFTVMFLTLPSGLVLYYFVNNLLGIGQQWLVNRHVLRLQQAELKKA